MALPITRLYSCGTLGRARPLDDQVFEVTLRPSQNELDASFQAQMPGIHTGLVSQSDSRACIEKAIRAAVLEVVKKMVLPGPFGTKIPSTFLFASRVLYQSQSCPIDLHRLCNVP